MARLIPMFLALLFLAAPTLAVDDTMANPMVRPYAVTSNATGVTMSFDDLTVNWTAEGETVVPKLPGAGELGEAGGPRLPVYSELIAVPEGLNLVVANVNVTWRDLGVRQLAHDTGQEFETPLDIQLFKKAARESEETVSVGKTGRWRDLRVASVAIRPMRIDEATGHVYVADDLDIEFAYEPDTDWSDDGLDPPGISEALLPLYETYVANATDFIDYSEVVRGTYLMIYPSQWEDPVRTLAAWRAQTGYTVQMATTAETGNSFDDIYAYIRNVYENASPPLEYVVLMGDIDDLPQIATEYIDPGSPWPIDPDIATDQMYTYDIYAGNTYEDVLPQYLIGRVSVDTETECLTMVNKIIQYESQPLIGNHPERWTRAVTIADATYAISTALTQDWVKWQFENNGFTDVHQIVRTWSNPGNAQMISNAINNHTSWVTYRGFGSHTYWAGPYFYDDDIEDDINNTDELVVITSMVCGGGAFDELDDDPCFGETWIRHGSPNDLKGAVAFIAPSEIDTHTRWNNMMLGGWYTAMFDQGLRTLGQCLLSAKIQLHNNYPYLWNAGGTNENSVWFYFHTYNILGDPALQLRAEVPKVLEVDHPTDLRENDTYVETLVLDQYGVPIDNAMVVVTTDLTDIVGHARTNASGVANVMLDEALISGGQYTLTVTRPDVEPYSYTFGDGGAGVVSLISTSGVEDASDPDTNNDGYINPGELIIPEALLEVVKDGGLDQMLVSISIPSEYGSVENSYQFFGTQGQGNQVTTDELRIRLNSTVANNTRVPVTFQVLSNDGNQSHLAELQQVKTPQLEVSDVVFQSDWYPGDQSMVDVHLDNLETLVGALSVTAQLMVDDPFITVLDGDGSWAAISGGATNVAMNDMFALEISDQAYPGHVAEGTMMLTTDRGFEIELDVEFVAMGSGPDVPTGPAGPGYYIFEDTDPGYDYTPNFTYVSVVGNGGWDVGLDDEDENEDDVVTIDLPFTFPYWDQFYDEVSICSNGWITFGDTGFYFFRNRPLPGALTPVGAVCALWDNLLFDTNNSGVFAYHDQENGYFVIEWYRVWHERDLQWNGLTGDPMYFQILILDPAVHGTAGDLGKIAILYDDIKNEDGAENYLTVGLTSPNGQEGLQYEFANENPSTAVGVVDGRQLMIAATNVAEPARLEYSPPLVQMNAEAGGNGSAEFTIRNVGGRATTFDIWPEGIDYSWGLPGELDNYGEPDDLGYRWYDSRESFGPEYQWVDIEQPGYEVTMNTGDPDGFGSISNEIDLPWDFDFYGETYSSFWVCESGYITFTEPADGYGESANTSLPRPYAPLASIFPYWDNIGTDEGGAVYVRTMQAAVVVTWADVHQLDWDTDDGPYTFQVVLTPDGAIHTQYQEMIGDLDSATIGINDESGDNGLLTVMNTAVPAFLEDELVVRFSPGLPWLTTTPTTHSIGKGESITVQLSADSDDLQAGLHQGRLLLLSHLTDEAYAIPIDFLVTDESLGYAPQIGDLAGESIAPGGTFMPIALDPYVEDWDDADADLDWVWYGSDSLNVSIDDNRIVTVTPVDGWNGPTTLFFRSTDPMLNYQTQPLVFDAGNANDPPRFLTASPDALGQTGLGTSVNFSVTVEDPEEDSFDLEWYHDGGFIGSGTSVDITFDNEGTTTVLVIAQDANGASSEIRWTGNVTDLGVNDSLDAPLPQTSSLEAVYPNPFNASVVLRYALPRSSDVQLVVYNLLGQEVARHMLPASPAGRHEIVLDATTWASGLYFLDWRAGDVRQVRKAVLLK